MESNNSDPSRPTWQAYWLAMANLVASRSTCLRRHVGAVLVIDNRAIATGYNGSASGNAHCIDVGCIREKQNIPSGQRLDLCVASHSEANAIAQAARFGVPIAGATLYCTTQPCAGCSKLIVQAGIRTVIYQGDYPDISGLDILRDGGVEAFKA